MHEMNELGQIVKRAVVTSQQRVIEGDGHASIAILDIEDDGVSAHLSPVADDPDSVVAGGHDSGEIHGPHFKVTVDRNRLLDDWRGQQSGNDHRLARLQEGAVEILVDLVDGLAQLGGSPVRSLRKVSPGRPPDAVPALGYVKRAPGR